MLPAERRCVGEPCIGHRLFSRTEMGDGVGDVGGVPEHDRGAGQTMRLTEAGVIKVFDDVRSGRTMERPGLEALLVYAREGGTLAVVRLDRLGRSLGELLTTVAVLKERGIALLSLEERIDTNSAAGELFMSSERFRAAPDRRADQGWNCRRPCEGQASGTPTPRC